MALVLALVLALVPLVGGTANAALAPALTRYPYLTDSIQSSVTVNWATDRSGTVGSVQWGPLGSCTANTMTTPTRTNISVGTVLEYQWKAVLPLSPDTTYCYRVMLGTNDLLGTDPTPQFTSQVAAGSAAPYSFAVFGDWGQAYANGVNVDQTNVLKQISLSGARFAVMTGDTAYPGGGQKEYGDLQQSGTDISTVFGPTFWGVPGRSMPVFNVTGNHGFTQGAVQVTNWPEDNAVATSNGKYLMESYPATSGANAGTYPSMWYAVDAGNTRLYMLTTSWADSNIIAPATVYSNDRDAHWAPGKDEYEWLKADLAAHPNALKFAFWHYPLYADSGGQPSDTFLQGGPGTLQGLLDANNVAIAFNGHAHGYQRNKPDPAGLVSYVLGNGGAALGSVSGCSSFDLYAIGTGGSHCGSAPSGLTNDHVFGFAKVTVNGRQVTVTPTDEMGRTYDIQTYNFPGSEPDSTNPTPPTVVTASAVSTSTINVAWSGATDNVGVTGYHLLRDGVQIADQAGTSFTDTTASPNTTYSYAVVALDAAGNLSPQSAAATVSTTGAPDATPPSQPAGLTASAPSSSQVNLVWSASTDNVGVTGYRVYRNGATTPLATPTSPDGTPPTTYTDDTASAGTAYTYQVSAVDAAGNESPKASAAVTTPAGSGGTLTFAPTDDATIDASQPTINFGTNSRLTVDNSPVNYALLKFPVTGTTGCNISSAKLRLTVGNTANDNSPYGGDVYGTTTSTWSQSTVTWNTAPTAGAAKIGLGVPTTVNLGTSYLFDVTPLVTGDGPVSMLIKSTSSDGARYYSKEGGTSTQAPQLQVTCGTVGPDGTAPSQPGNLAASAPSSGQVNLSWTASTDNVAVTSYRVYRNGATTPLATPGAATTTYSDSTVTPGTDYTYQVSAIDAAGNESPKASASVTTPAAGGGTLSFAPTDDATVDASQPTINFGTNSRLTVDNSPVNYALLKFPVTGTTGCNISSAKLRLTVGNTANDNSPYGGDVYGTTTSTWSEGTVTWNTAPTAGAAKIGLGVPTTVNLGTSYLFDVTPLVTGDGPVSMLIKSTSSDGARYYSEEGGTSTQAPQLQITCR